MCVLQQDIERGKEMTKDNPTTEEKIELLLQTIVSSVLFLSLIGLASMVLVGFLYPPPLNWVISALSILLALMILFTMKRYTKM